MGETESTRRDDFRTSVLLTASTCLMIVTVCSITLALRGLYGLLDPGAVISGAEERVAAQHMRDLATGVCGTVVSLPAAYFAYIRSLRYR